MLKRSRLILLLCLAVFTSGWVRIPVPRALLSKELSLEGGVELQIEAQTARFSWARGQVEATELQLMLDGETVVVAPTARLHVGLLPFASSFLKPRLLELQGPQIELDEELLRRLPDTDESQPSELPELAFAVEGGRLIWNTAHGQTLAWEVQALRGRLSRARSDVAQLEVSKLQQ